MIKIIIASLFTGGTLGSIALWLIQRKYNKKKEDITLAIEFQSFYRKEIESIENNKKEQKEEISELKSKLNEITVQLSIVIEQNKEFKEAIEHKDKNLLLHENELAKRDGIIKQKIKVISDQEIELKKYRP